MAETLIPGDTVIGADDASCYTARGRRRSGRARRPPPPRPWRPGHRRRPLGVGAAIGAALRRGRHRHRRRHRGRPQPAGVPRHGQRGGATSHGSTTRSRASPCATRCDPAPPPSATTTPTGPWCGSRAPPSRPSHFRHPPSRLQPRPRPRPRTWPPPRARSRARSAALLGAVGDAISTVDSVVNEAGAALGQKVPYEVYEHHGPALLPQWAAFAADDAPRILRQKRRRASIAEGEGGCSDASPGHRFALADHPATHLDGPYVVTRVEHRGQMHSRGRRPTDVLLEHLRGAAPAVVTSTPRDGARSGRACR